MPEENLEKTEENQPLPGGKISENPPAPEGPKPPPESQIPENSPEISSQPESQPDKILPRLIEEEMKTAYINYAMSVIVGRALPDVRDGLKPVHRRILYSMYKEGLFHNKPFKKCANIVGYCLGHFHPHGDASVYDALVRMAQDFSLRYPLIKGQGNFGCFTGDTKVKLADGRELSFLELIEEEKLGKKNYTFTINSQGEIEIAEIKSPRLTKKNQELVKITLDNNSEIKCTLNHRFMLRNGSYREAQELKKGDNLKSLKNFNHKVINIEFLSGREDVYDLTIENTHNFALATGIFVHNSIDGDPPAAYRYTEAKLNKIAEEMLKDIDKNTVNFVDNFDASLKEPVVLPNKIPNLLINGSSGIAVGMATNIPPHNLKEACTAIIETINNPDISVEELMQIMPGPDFPTGAEIVCGQGLRMAYAHGKGRVTIKAVTEIEEDKIIVREIPYQINKSELIEQIAELVKDKKIPGIRNINDESDREGIRIVIDLRKDVDPNLVLNQLYSYSRLKTTFGITFLALVDNQPKILGLKEIINHHISHRKEVITRRTQYELNLAQERAHILEGLLIALAHVEEVVAGIKRCRTVEEAQKFLMGSYNLSEVQAKAILDLRLQKLASLEQEKIRQEQQETIEKIKWCQEVLASEQKVLDLIKEELLEIKANYGDERRSKITISEEEDFDIDIESLIEEETVVVTLTNAGYLKRISLDEYRTQKRGGKGIKATEMKGEDFVENVYITSTHDYLLFFTDQGQMYWQKVYQIPEGSRQAKGKHVSNLIELSPDEKINAVIPVRDLSAGYLFMATKKGTVKKTELVEFFNLRKGGIRALNLEENDQLVGVKHTDGSKEIILATKFGNANRFEEKDVRAMGRTAYGVRGIRLEEDDEVIGMLAAEEGLEILTLTEKGYGKRTPVSEYRLCNRGGKGVTNIKITEKNGPVKSVMLVDGSEELLIISKNGIAIRIKCTDISVIGRATQGVRVIKLSEEDQLAAAAKLASDSNGQNGNEDKSGQTKETDQASHLQKEAETVAGPEKEPEPEIMAGEFKEKPEDKTEEKKE